MAKDRIDDLPFNWQTALGLWAAEDDEGTDDEDHFGKSGSSSGSGISGGDHSGMSSGSGEDSGSGDEYVGTHHMRMDPPAVALNNVETTLDGPPAVAAATLATQVPVFMHTRTDSFNLDKFPVLFPFALPAVCPFIPLCPPVYDPKRRSTNHSLVLCPCRTQTCDTYPRHLL
jgi:hypothetical protein